MRNYTLAYNVNTRSLVAPEKHHAGETDQGVNNQDEEGVEGSQKAEYS